MIFIVIIIISIIITIIFIKIIDWKTIATIKMIAAVLRFT